MHVPMLSKLPFLSEMLSAYFLRTGMNKKINKNPYFNTPILLVCCCTVKCLKGNSLRYIYISVHLSVSLPIYMKDAYLLVTQNIYTQRSNINEHSG